MIVMCADLDASLLCDISCVEGFVIYSNNIYILVVMLQSILQAQHKRHEQTKIISFTMSLTCHHQCNAFHFVQKKGVACIKWGENTKLTDI